MRSEPSSPPSSVEAPSVPPLLFPPPLDDLLPLELPSAPASDEAPVALLVAPPHATAPRASAIDIVIQSFQERIEDLQVSRPALQRSRHCGSALALGRGLPRRCRNAAWATRRQRAFLNRSASTLGRTRVQTAPAGDLLQRPSPLALPAVKPPFDPPAAVWHAAWIQRPT